MPREEPAFTRTLHEGAFEVRDYAPTVVAEVTVTGDSRDASRKGFRLLASYIFGGNATRQGIAMTTPVTKYAQPARGTGQQIAMTAPVTQVADAGRWLVRFTMPHRYALADLPVPNDPAVTLRALPSTRQAVLRFSGLTGEARVATMTARLATLAAQRGLVPTGPAAVARYDPPWTPWFLRRNEVMLPVAGA